MSRGVQIVNRKKSHPRLSQQDEEKEKKKRKKKIKMIHHVVRISPCARDRTHSNWNHSTRSTLLGFVMASRWWSTAKRPISSRLTKRSIRCQSCNACAYWSRSAHNARDIVICSYYAATGRALRAWIFRKFTLSRKFWRGEFKKKIKTNKNYFSFPSLRFSNSQFIPNTYLETTSWTLRRLFLEYAQRPSNTCRKIQCIWYLNWSLLV